MVTAQIIGAVSQQMSLGEGEKARHNLYCALKHEEKFLGATLELVVKEVRKRSMAGEALTFPRDTIGRRTYAMDR